MPARLALILYVLWTVTLALALVGWRTRLVAQGAFRWSGFTAGSEHGPAAYWRLNRVHANAAENLPLFAAVVLLAGPLGAPAPLFDALAVVVLGARVGQGITHLSSARSRAVLVRGSFFLLQLAALLGMLGWLAWRL